MPLQMLLQILVHILHAPLHILPIRRILDPLLGILHVAPREFFWGVAKKTRFVCNIMSLVSKSAHETR